MFFSKEINKLISKEMSNIYYWQKLTFSKFAGKSKFHGNTIWRNALAWKSKEVQGIRGETFILA